MCTKQHFPKALFLDEMLQSMLAVHVARKALTTIGRLLAYHEATDNLSTKTKNRNSCHEYKQELFKTNHTSFPF